MNRKEFFQLAGLGAGGLLIAPAVIGSAWTTAWDAEAVVHQAIETAVREGALYADARIGTCQMKGEQAREVLGMRVCMDSGWRHFVLEDVTQATLPHQLAAALQATGTTASAAWATAHFDSDQRLAHRTTDPETERALNTAWMRYAERPARPKDAQSLYFCDLILEY